MDLNDANHTAVEDHLMTIEELAEYLRVKKRTIYEWLKQGKIPAMKTVGQWRFRKKKIEEWLESQQ
jgi:excisionase family DNA binding protein